MHCIFPALAASLRTFKSTISFATILAFETGQVRRTNVDQRIKGPLAHGLGGGDARARDERDETSGASDYNVLTDGLHSVYY